MVVLAQHAETWPPLKPRYRPKLKSSIVRSSEEEGPLTMPADPPPCGIPCVRLRGEAWKGRQGISPTKSCCWSQGWANPTLALSLHLESAFLSSGVFSCGESETTGKFDFKPSQN